MDSVPASGILFAESEVRAGAAFGPPPLIGGAIVAITWTWFEYLTGLVRHNGGILLPSSTLNASALTKTELWEQFVPYPVAECLYIAPEQDTDFDATLRVFAPYLLPPGRGISGIPVASTWLDYWADGETDLGVFANWTVGYALLRYMRMAILLTPGVVPGYLTSFIPTADTPTRTIQVGDTVIAPGGTVVTFPEAFHSPPAVICQVVGTTSLTVVITGVTETTFTAHIFNTMTGADVGGTINYTAVGD